MTKFCETSLPVLAVKERGKASRLYSSFTLQTWSLLKLVTNLYCYKQVPLPRVNTSHLLNSYCWEPLHNHKARKLVSTVHI